MAVEKGHIRMTAGARDMDMEEDRAAADELIRWCFDAVPGDEMVYARGVSLIAAGRALTGRQAYHLAERGRVMLYQKKDYGRLVDGLPVNAYVARRIGPQAGERLAPRPRAAAPAQPAGEPRLEKVAKRRLVRRRREG